MPFFIVQHDITKIPADVIVNAANTDLLMGGGVCGAIFNAAGPEELQAACDKLAPIETGEAVITPGFNLPARFIIHTAGPIYQPSEKERCEQQLRAAYTNSLKRAVENDCVSVAFPLISSGIYGYPKEEALRVAITAIRDFLTARDLTVFLVLFDASRFFIDGKPIESIEGYVDARSLDFHELLSKKPREKGLGGV
ncbi:MAG TPA: macro domain-containing protein [Thermotogota bacterium]|nr:macro domain-containing protein [Thermotogota bacterium]HOX65464.1 macro domain-containing protein [Thermotogota bacterium]HPY47542.1 macro domain-containing protein [Thermotogota bacterium]HQK82023.1 macro domain-containing protein [Thermotogota bacterium]